MSRINRTMNNLEAWDIIRNKYLDGGKGVMSFQDTAQYVMSKDEGGMEVMISGDFDARELQAIGWYLASPEDFDYLRGFYDGQEEDEVLSSDQTIRS